MEGNKFRNNTKKRRYELDLGDGYIAMIDYVTTPDGHVALTHTEVPYEFEGKGYGKELVKRCLQDIKDSGRKVVPACGFVAAYIRRNPEWAKLVAER